VAVEGDADVLARPDRVEDLLDHAAVDDGELGAGTVVAVERAGARVEPPQELVRDRLGDVEEHDVRALDRRPSLVRQLGSEPDPRADDC
jgi:hypothetical protein